MERNENRPTPQIPWPLVHPPAKLVPNPTKNAPIMTTGHDKSIESGNLLANIAAKKGPDITPIRKTLRQTNSVLSLVKAPFNIPEMPATRPLNNNRTTADKPIIVPPINPEIGVNSVILSCLQVAITMIMLYKY